MTKGKGQISEDDAKNRFWRGLGDLVQIEGSGVSASVSTLAQPQGLPLQREFEAIGRRDILKLMAASAALAGLSA